MNIDHTNLLKVLKRNESNEPTDVENREVANELHDWLMKKEYDK